MDPSPADGGTTVAEETGGNADFDALNVASNIQTPSSNQPTGETKVDHPIPPSEPVEKVVETKTTHDEGKKNVLSAETLGLDADEILSLKPKTTEKKKETSEKGKEEVAPVVEETKPAAPPKPSESTKRDYSMFRKEHAAVLEKTSNEAFNFLKEYLPKAYEAEKKLKEVEARVLPDTYYQHPESYVLSEEFKSAQTDYRYASFEERHWQEQLLAVRDGATSFKELVQFKDGQPVFQEVKVDPTKVAHVEEFLRRNTLKAGQAKENAAAGAQQIQRSWTSQMTEVVNALKSAEDKYYPFYKTPTEAQKKIIDEIHSMIPPQFRNSPTAGMLAKSGALNVELVNKVRELMQENAQLKAGRIDKTKVGPSGSEVTSSGGGAPEKILSPKMFGDL